MTIKTKNFFLMFIEAIPEIWLAEDFFEKIRTSSNISGVCYFVKSFAEHRLLIRAKGIPNFSSASNFSLTTT